MKFLRIKTVTSLVGLSKSTLYLMISKGEFPQSVSLGARAVGWLDTDIQSWIDGRLSQRGE